MFRYKISALQKKKLIDMTKFLFQGTRRVFITKSGNIYISKGIFRWVKVHIFEMCTSILPIKLKSFHDNIEEKAYSTVYNKYGYIVIDLLNSGKTTGDIIDYLYKEFSLLRYNIKYIDIFSMVEVPSVAISISTSFLPSPIALPLSTQYLKGNFNQLLSTISPERDSICSKIKRLVNNLRVRHKRKQKKSTQLRMLLQVNLR
jgi:hypothetical protein